MTTTFAEAPKPVEKTSWSKEEVKQIAIFYAKKYNVSDSTMLYVVNCESSFDHKAIGDGGQSFGISQIHSPSHPDITKDEAFNPYFASEFMASNISKGKGNMWTCYTKYKNNHLKG